MDDHLTIDVSLLPFSTSEYPQDDDVFEMAENSLAKLHKYVMPVTV